MAGFSHSLQVPQKMQPIYDEIVAATDAFCRAHLNDSYMHLCRAMAAVLSRKRPSPLESGRIGSWVAGIVYALGQVNFLFDKLSEPYISAVDLCARLNVSKGTASSKARLIGDMLDIVPMDPRWCLPELVDDNPLAWMIQINGFIVDVRKEPQEIQVLAYQKGLIPYIPYQKSDKDK